MRTKILVVIDMQNDFITGSLGSPQAQAIVPNVKRKIEQAIENGDIIIYTCDTHNHPSDGLKYCDTLEGRDLPKLHCIAGTDGWNICPEIADLLEKHGKGWMKHAHGTIAWDDILATTDLDWENGIDIEFIGLCTDICVLQNAIIFSVLYRSVDITVDASCCAGVTEESHKAALMLLKLNHIKVINE